MPHVTHVTASCHTCHCVKSCVTHITASYHTCHTDRCVMSHISLRHVTHVTASCYTRHTDHYVMPHVFLRRVTHTNASYVWYDAVIRGLLSICVLPRVTHCVEPHKSSSCHSHVWLTHIDAHITVQYHTFESRMNAPCHTYMCVLKSVLSYIWMTLFNECLLNVSCHHECLMSHIRSAIHIYEGHSPTHNWLNRRIIHTNTSYHTYEYLKSYIPIHHITHMNASYHTRECLMNASCHTYICEWRSSTHNLPHRITRMKSVIRRSDEVSSSGSFAKEPYLWKSVRRALLQKRPDVEYRDIVSKNEECYRVKWLLRRITHTYYSIVSNVPMPHITHMNAYECLIAHIWMPMNAS